jgi:TIR domain
MPPTVFISYSRKDQRWKDGLVSQLGVLEREGLLRSWHDGMIQPGTDWLPAIEAAMAEARVAVFIISADFLNSDFIRRKETPALMERRLKEGLLIIPVIARPCPWHKVTWLAGIQARPLNGKTLARLGGVKAEEVLSDLAEEILKLVEGMASSGPEELGPRISASASGPHGPAPTANFLRRGHLAGDHTAASPVQSTLASPAGTDRAVLAKSPRPSRPPASGPLAVWREKLSSVLKQEARDDRPDDRSSRSAPLWVPVCGLLIGLLTLLFFMYLVLREGSVPCDRHVPVIIVLALGAAMAYAFIGGWATAEGKLPIDPHLSNVITVSAGGGIAVLLALIVLGVKLYPCPTVPPPGHQCPPKTDADLLVDTYTSDIGTLRGTAEARNPDWESRVREEGLTLAKSIGEIDEERLTVARKVARHEYKAWALLMVASAYAGPGRSEDGGNRLGYAAEALQDLDQALAMMHEITLDHQRGDECAAKVYRWMTGHSADLLRTHYLKAVALAVIAQAGGGHTKDDVKRELKELGKLDPEYLKRYPPETNPDLAWATQ